ncbi:MAG: glutamate 5-kinase [Ruminococcaceae bacterium]|nr:glutamate 5-kinase [Oscillospiraceae bacterium]
MEKVKNAKRIVVKVGSSTLTYENGKLNLQRIEKMCRVLSDLKNTGREVVLVSSGAVSAGIGKLNLERRPTSVEEKQALAAVGQGVLMMIYERFFGEYGHSVAQILLTRDIVNNPTGKTNAENTFAILLKMGCIPIVNENDTVAFDEIKFGDNDTLSAYVSVLADADLLINMSDTDGFYDSDPRTNPDAKMLKRVEKVDEALYACADGAGSARGTGGMTSKLHAAEIACGSGIPMMIVSGEDFSILYDMLYEGIQHGSYFAPFTK